MVQPDSTISLKIEDVVRNKEVKISSLNDILKAIASFNSKLDLDYVLKQVVRYAAGLTNSGAASIILAGNSENELVIAHSTDLKKSIKFPRHKGIAGACIDSGEIKIVNDVKKCELYYDEVDKDVGTYTHSILCFPLILNGETIGCVELMNKKDGTVFNNDDIAIAAIISSLASVSIRNSEIHERLQREYSVLERQVPQNSMVIGNDKEFNDILKKVKKLKDGKTHVLILGESGTGKGVLAKYIHDNSIRNKSPFVTISCALYSETLLESELFGHEKGAFTGADKQKKGRFELAAGGTVFLDEIGEMDNKAQVKLLQVLQEKTFERVGGTETLTADVRIIAATNANLKEAVRNKKFREDLYFRIKVIDFELPPLRNRLKDVPRLANFFLEKYRNELNRFVLEFDDESREALCRYDYPGNIRELENAVERAVVLAEDDVIHIHDLPDEIRFEKPCGERDFLGTDERTLPGTEEEMVRNALIKCKGNQTKAAKLLGITRDKMRYRIARYNIPIPHKL